MKNWTWPAVAVFGIVVGALVVMFVATDDLATRNRLVGALEIIVAFIAGAAAAGTAGWHLGRVSTSRTN